MIAPPHIGAFEFVVLASLRTAQLTRGCVPKMPTTHKHTVTAQCEVAAGLVTNAGLQSPDSSPDSESTASRAPDLPEPTGRSQQRVPPTLTSTRAEAAPVL
jgi:hypothetical protein